MRRTTTVLAAAVALCSPLVFGDKASAHWDSDPYNLQASYVQNHQCGPNDHRETGIQGDVPKADQTSGEAKKGYNCGLALVGHATLDYGGRPPTGNANMAWADHCAYIADGGALVGKPSPGPHDGVAVVDVSDPSHPKDVGLLQYPGSVAVAETIGRVTTPSGRSILVVGQYGNPDLSSPPIPMDVYDVSAGHCDKPVHMATFWFPENIHNLSVSPDGRFVFATMPLQVIDISGLWNFPLPTNSSQEHPDAVKYLGDLDKATEGPPVAPGPSADYWSTLPEQVRQNLHPLDSGHEAWFSNNWLAGDNTIYIGGQTPQFEAFSLVDVGKWLQRDANNNALGPPRIISITSGRAHSMRTATINGVPYLLHSEESVGVPTPCVPETANPVSGVAQPWLTNISDPTNPRLVSQMALEINNPAHCTDAEQSGIGATVHYHDVDNPNDTTFVMASMGNAGIRIFDVRDPVNPTEVGYFNPADVNPNPGTTTLDRAWAHIRYVAQTGEIWFTTASGGFWVVRIEGKLRNDLTLDQKNGAHGLSALYVPLDDPGRPGTLGAGLPNLSLSDYLISAPNC